MQEVVRDGQQGSKWKFSLVLTLKRMTSLQSFNSLSCGSPVSLISKSRSCFSCSGGCHSHTWRLSNNLQLIGYPQSLELGGIKHAMHFRKLPKKWKSQRSNHATILQHEDFYECNTCAVETNERAHPTSARSHISCMK